MALSNHIPATKLRTKQLLYTYVNYNINRSYRVYLERKVLLLYLKTELPAEYYLNGYMQLCLSVLECLSRQYWVSNLWGLFTYAEYAYMRKSLDFGLL